MSAWIVVFDDGAQTMVWETTIVLAAIKASATFPGRRIVTLRLIDERKAK